MNTNSNNPTLTPLKMAVIQRLMGTKYRKIKNRIIPAKTIKSNIAPSISIVF
jgi:hypothetical protein